MKPCNRSWRLSTGQASEGIHPSLPRSPALAIILQAYTGVSDDEVRDRDPHGPKLPGGVELPGHRSAAVESKEHSWPFGDDLSTRRLDRRLIERTIELASHSQEFRPRQLRAALDSSPLWGTGRVEDTYNLIGHARKKTLRLGASQREEALELVVQVLQTVETWVQTLQQDEVELAEPSLEIAHQVKEQNVQVDENGKTSLINGVAKDRRISVEDAEMRHGRKSRSVRVDGYKRHVLHDLDTGFIRAVGITPANVPEASVTREISADLEQQAVSIKELHIDRGYLSSHLVHERSDELEVYCKAWPVREGKRFSKWAFMLDWERQVIRCPAEQEMPFVSGGIVHFSKDICAQCALKIRCTTSANGRSVSIHPDEARLDRVAPTSADPTGTRSTS